MRSKGRHRINKLPVKKSIVLSISFIATHPPHFVHATDKPIALARECECANRASIRAFGEKLSV